MKIYFARHGQTVHNKNGWVTGHTNSQLTEEGVLQAQDSIKEVPHNITLICTSDLDRCIKTADILNTNLQVPIVIDSSLRERSFGSLEGKSWDDIDPNGELRDLDKNQKYDYEKYGGEKVENVKERIFTSIKDLKIKYPDDTILIVTSGGIIRLLHNVLNGQVYGHIDNSSIHEFDFRD